MIAIFGGTGTIGSFVAEALAAQGAAARLLTRSPGRADARLETIYADPVHPASLEPALRGAERLFLLTPHGPRQLAMELALIEAAARAGVQGIVKISGANASIGPNGPTPTAVTHFHSERAIEATGLDFCHLRPSFLMQNLLTTVAPIVRARGLLATPLARAPIAMVDARDVAAVAARQLLAPALGRTSVPVTGPAAVTHRDLARLIGVPCLPVPPGVARRALQADGADAWELDHAMRMIRFLQSGADATVSGAVQEITGTPARSVEPFLREHATAFGGVTPRRFAWPRIPARHALQEER